MHEHQQPAPRKLMNSPPADADGVWANAADHTPVGMAILDEGGRILRANACMGHLGGRAARSMVGLDFGAIVVANDRDAWLRDRGEVVRHGRTVFDRERRIFRADGMMIWLSLSIAPIVHDGRPMDPDARMMLVASDISGRKRLQDAFQRGQAELRDLVEARTSELRAAHLRLRLADRMAVVGTLGAGLGHDMNNVLLPVRAHLNALEAMVDGDGAAEHVTSIRQSLAYLQQLSDGLHFLAMDPDLETATSQTDLREWWPQVAVIIPKALPRGVSFECALPVGLPPIGVAPHRLTQAVLNLVVNAGEAMRPSLSPASGREARENGDGTGPRALVRLWAEPVSPLGPEPPASGRQPPTAVRIGVSDNGSGMPAEVVRRAGNLYYTTKSRGMGTGLGLPLVRMVVDQAGGTMDIESAQGAGTTVSLVLPVAGGSDPHHEESASGHAATDESSARTTESGVGDDVTHGDDR